MPKPKETWKTESEMFEAFMPFAQSQGWILYPECAGHDLVMVAGPDLDKARWPGVRVGDMVAVEGKLKPSLKVLSQACPKHIADGGNAYGLRTGADWYAVLIPYCDGDFALIARGLGIQVIVFPKDGVELAWWRQTFRDVDRCPIDITLPIPNIHVKLVPGKPAPRQVTKWKVGAVRVCLLALSRENHTLTKQDFRDHDINAQPFLDEGWMVPYGKDGRSTVYQLAEGRCLRPDLRNPEIVAAILES